MYNLDRERLDDLVERVCRLEKTLREYWSKTLELEARISELEEKEPPDGT